MAAVLWSCVIVLLLGHRCTSQTYEDVDRLIASITNSSTYKAHIRPARYQIIPTRVNISMGLYWLDNFDLSNGKVEMAGNMVISWFDEYLTWNPLQYGGLTRVYLQDGVFWKPKILNVKEELSITDSDISGMILTFYGLIYYITAQRYASTCLTDIHNMPFDSHDCTLDIFPAGYDITELLFFDAEIYKDKFIEHQEWHTEDLSSNITTFLMSHYVISVVQFKFTLRRRPARMLMHTILPYFLTVSLNLVACFLPVDSGERVSFSLTLFLSFVFVVSGIADNIPPDSKDLSFFSTFSAMLHILNTFSVAWSVIVTSVANLPEETAIPQSLKTVYSIVKRTGRTHSTSVNPVNAMGRTNSTSVTTVNAMEDNRDNPDLQNVTAWTEMRSREGNVTEISDDTEAHVDDAETLKVLDVKSNESSDDIAISWKQVSACLDKLYLLTSIFMYTVSFTVYSVLILLY